jgi:hypothetical protein
VRAVALTLLAALLAAAPAAGGDLIRYRAADGSIGLVDHPSKIPPGAAVLERSKATERPPDAEADEETAPPAPRPPRSQPAARAEEPDVDEAASEWCDRGRAAAERLQRAEAELAELSESYERCDNPWLYMYCSRSDLDAAEYELAGAQSAVEELQDECRRAGCEPGWLRCAP